MTALFKEKEIIFIWESIRIREGFSRRISLLLLVRYQKQCEVKLKREGLWCAKGKEGIHWTVELGIQSLWEG